MDMLAGSVKDTGGLYFVTAFAGLLAPYWDRTATGTMIGMTLYTTSAHIARATLEAVCFQTREVLDVIEAESGEKLEVLKVDGGLTNSDLAMQIQANVSLSRSIPLRAHAYTQIGDFKVCRPSMRESTALGSALLAGYALGLFGWDIGRPETLAKVNTADTQLFEPSISDKKRIKMRKGWARAVERARNWRQDEDDHSGSESDDEVERIKGGGDD
jgi:glycerol kinase